MKGKKLLRRVVLTHFRPSDNNALNFIGSFINLGDFGIAEHPLYREVAKMATAAASKDPRFHPLEKNELDNFSLEISVLSPLEKLDDIEQIEVGVHGLYIEKNFSRGVLLPQVATEHNWDRITFLQQTCLKAGLPKNTWQSADAEIYIFSAQIISEKEIK